jgi:hypothetical protein
VASAVIGTAAAPMIFEFPFDLIVISSARLDQRHQHIEGASTQLDRQAVGEQLAAVRHDPEMAELDDRRRF